MIIEVKKFVTEAKSIIVLFYMDFDYGRDNMMYAVG